MPPRLNNSPINCNLIHRAILLRVARFLPIFYKNPVENLIQLL